LEIGLLRLQDSSSNSTVAAFTELAKVAVPKILGERLARRRRSRWSRRKLILNRTAALRESKRPGRAKTKAIRSGKRSRNIRPTSWIVASSNPC